MNLSLTNLPNMRQPLLGRSFPLRSTCTLNLQCIRMGNQFSFLHLKDKYMFMYNYGPWYYCIQSNNFAQIYSRNFYLSLYHTEVFQLIVCDRSEIDPLCFLCEFIINCSLFQLLNCILFVNHCIIQLNSCVCTGTFMSNNAI